MASHDRLAGYHVALQRAHDDLRRQLRSLRADLGRRHPDGPGLPAHCLAFCAALTAHHQGEDGGLFVQLRRERPDLAGLVAKLIEDHDVIATILSRLAALAERAVGAPRPTLDAIGRELDGLTAIMDSHFAFEERVLRSPRP